jgi:uncharacterized protein YggU (UPF0235/DUF167 family)
MAAAGAHPWHADKAGLRLLARVTPKSAMDGVDGVTPTPEGPALKVRVRAVADKGEANAAVETVVARWLGLAKTRVTVARGHKSRVKTLAIGGVPAELEALVAARVAQLG